MGEAGAPASAGQFLGNGFPQVPRAQEFVMVPAIPVNEHLRDPMQEPKEEPMEDPKEAGPPEEADECNQPDDSEEDNKLVEGSPTAEQVLENKTVT